MTKEYNDNPINRVKMIQIKKKYYLENKEYFTKLHRKNHLKRFFDLTPEEFNEKLASQDYKCAICYTTEPKGPANQWCVDHNHDTGQVRGLLCDNCNRGLGHFKENSEALIRAIKYLDNWDL